VNESFSSQALRLSETDLLLSFGLVLIAGLVSVLLRLRLERTLLVAALRTVVQLTLVGFVLRSVFEIRAWWAVAPVLLVMIAAASAAAVRRPTRTYSGVLPLAFVTLLLTGMLTTYSVTGVIIGVEPWYRPQYAIPLLGMILGNGLTGISLCLDTLLETLAERRSEVEMELAHGASRWEAAERPLREAVRRGMLPIINAMMVVGIVSLPGMMTGQILAGADPLEAVKYQILVMFMIAAATSLGSMLVGMLSCRRLFDAQHRLLWDRIERRRP
jgi:putative ABC transport system permease protein